MGSPEEKIGDRPQKLPGLEFSRGVLNRLIIEEGRLEEQLKDVREARKYCEGYIKTEEKFGETE